MNVSFEDCVKDVANRRSMQNAVVLRILLRFPFKLNPRMCRLRFCYSEDI